MGTYTGRAPQLRTHAQVKGSLLTFSPPQRPASAPFHYTTPVAVPARTNNGYGEGKVSLETTFETV